MSKSTSLRLIVAKSAGFCYGVRRAVRTVEEALAGGLPAVTLGPIVHNPHVVARLGAMGAKVVEDSDGVLPGQRAVIRSHGASRETMDRLAAAGAEILDATCPCVKRIHDLVAAAQEGPVIVVGDAEHPEVRAIASHARGDAYVVADARGADALPELSGALVVAQTTMARDVWEAAVAALRERIAKLTAIDTICAATAERQAEAVAIAKEVDAMLIIGGWQSANTKKLYELCSKHTNAYLIEEASEIPVRELVGAQAIGITAGASTPDEIIKEVVTFMSELDNKTQEEIMGTDETAQAQPVADDAAETQEPVSDENSNFMAEFEKTLVSIKPGQVVVGTIVQITEDEVCVNIGYKSDGIIPRAELTSDGDPRDEFKIGDEIEVEVVKVNDGEGNVLLSQRNILVMKNWDGLVEKADSGEYVEGIGKDVVKGGLICSVMGVRTFVPASQLAERYVEKIDQFIGQEMKLKIIEVDRTKRRLVASRKAVIVEESKKIKEGLWEKLVVGSTVHGVVRRLTDFGAFVDIGGMDGLIHVTDLSWGRVRQPSDGVKPTDVVPVQVPTVARAREPIALGLKQLQAKPWDNAPVTYPVGSIVEGKVVRMVTFGAFVELEPGLDGLVHISQISNTRVNRVEDALQVGQMVQVKVLDVNPEAKRISLSIREALGANAPHDMLDELPTDLGEAVLAASSESFQSDPDAVPVGEGIAEVLSPTTGESARNDEEPSNEVEKIDAGEETVNE